MKSNVATAKMNKLVAALFLDGFEKEKRKMRQERHPVSLQRDWPRQIRAIVAG
jgi:hypothetical protein